MSVPNREYLWLAGQKMPTMEEVPEYHRPLLDSGASAPFSSRAKLWCVNAGQTVKNPL